MQKILISIFIVLFLLTGCSSVSSTDDASQNMLQMPPSGAIDEKMNVNDTSNGRHIDELNFAKRGSKEEQSLGETWTKWLAEKEEKQKENTSSFWIQQATRCAESYLRNVSGFSKQGLIDQLIYEGFDENQATKAVQGLNVNWKEQAVILANRYMRLGGFSFDGLVEQLEYEGFTHDQARYGALQVNVY